MKVQIWRVDGPQFHAHAPGCADTKKRRYAGQDDPWDAEVETVDDVVMDVYPPDQFEYDPKTNEMNIYRADIVVFPCTGIAS